MKFRRKTTLMMIIVVLAATAAMAGEGAWFDMENCAMCKNLTMQKGLLENMSWETYDITNGIVAVAVVKPDYVKSYRKAHMGMMKAGEKMGQGEKMEMCGSCSALGMCMMQGVNQEYVETTHGDVWIVTSDKAETVASLQKWSKRNMTEMARMHGHGDDHDGHGHEGHNH